MKATKSIALFFLLFNLTLNVYAQSGVTANDTLRSVHLRIVDIKTQEPIGLAHVINLTQHKGGISDLLGYINLSIAFGDSLTVSAIGYNTKEIVNWGQFKPDTIFNSVQLTPRLYEIEEVKISRFSTYERFLREVVNLKLPKTSEQELEDRLHKYLFGIIKGVDIKSLPNGLSGASFGKDWYTKQKEKLAELIEKERERRIIDQKYNPGLIQELTGLNGDELYKFMGQIDIENDFIKKASDYEIREKVLKEFENYKRKKDLNNDKSKDNGTLPSDF